MFSEFKSFIMRGNVIDLAVAVIMGASFGVIVDSLVKDVVMPPIGLALGNVDFSSLYINLSGKSFESLADAKAAGAATINYGLFINSIIGFVIVSFVLFLIIRQVNRLAPKPVEPAKTQTCPYCDTAISIKASRCPNCTSNLRGQAVDLGLAGGAEAHKN